MKEVDVINLDNGEEYYEIDKVVYEENEYVLLANASDIKDICIRKIVKDGNEEYLGFLNDSEFDKVSKKFYEKNKALF